LENEMLVLAGVSFLKMPHRILHVVSAPPTTIRIFSEVWGCKKAQKGVTL
jgi:hypothetical protein